MARIVKDGTCKHCKQPISQRVYAAPYSPNPDHAKYGVRIWVEGNGAYPGDQKVCESHILPDDIGSYGNHEPAEKSVIY